MKGVIFLLTVLVCSLKLSAQFGDNLVPNPSFETISSCPGNFTEQIHHAPPWFSPGTAGSDLHLDCNSTIPYNYFGMQYAFSGNAYAGFYTYHTFNTDSSYRKYLSIKLTDSLLANKNYCVEYYISLADSVNFATITGAYFSVDSIYSGSSNHLAFSPQISASPVISKNDWILIEGEFIANGGETYMTIGNFYDDLNSDTTFVAGGDMGNPDYNASYYYIDDISVIFCDEINSATKIEEADEFRVYPNPFREWIRVKWTENLSDPKERVIRIFNVLGEEVKKIAFTGNAVNIPAEALPPGYYFVELEPGVVRKLVKQ